MRLEMLMVEGFGQKFLILKRLGLNRLTAG